MARKKHHRRGPKPRRTWLYEPNRAEVGHYLRRFRGRRRRVKLLLTFGLALLLGLVTLAYMKPELFFHDGDLMHPKMTGVLAAAVALSLELAIVVVSFYYWRCAHCETFAGLRWDPDVCRHCGAKLAPFLRGEEPTAATEPEQLEADVETDEPTEKGSQP